MTVEPNYIRYVRDNKITPSTVLFAAYVYFLVFMGFILTIKIEQVAVILLASLPYFIVPKICKDALEFIGDNPADIIRRTMIRYKLVLALFGAISFLLSEALSRTSVMHSY
jgi:hypothetical protein